MAQKQWLGSEREMLSKKLDDDLDKFIEELAQKRDPLDRKKPFDFDEWCKEIDKHPAFLKDLTTDENGEYSKAVQALQALKYDEDDTNVMAEELSNDAEYAKMEGNKHFKFQKYRWAVDAYTNGIRLCCPDSKLNSVLYANRAAAQKRLGNIRSALKDCVISRKFDCSHKKAIVRGAECLLELGFAQQCIDWLDSSLKQLNDFTLANNNENSFNVRVFEELRARARRMLAKELRDARKQRVEDAHELCKIRTLLGVLRLRGIYFKTPKLLMIDEDNDVDALHEWYNKLHVVIPQFDKIPIVYYEDTVDQLVWPLLIQYPEFGQTDLIVDCFELTPLKEILSNLLTCIAEWDKKNEICANNVRLFMPLEGTVDEKDQILEVSFNDCLFKLLSKPNVAIIGGLPVLQIYTKAHIARSAGQIKILS